MFTFAYTCGHSVNPIIFFKLKAAFFLLNLPTLSDVLIIMNSRCPEFTLQKISEQLESSFGSLNIAMLGPYNSQLRYSAQKHMKREKAMSSKRIHTEPLNGGKPKNTP